MPRPRNTGCSRRRIQTPRRASTPPRRRWRCCRCWTSSAPTSVVSDILTLAPSLAAEQRRDSAGDPDPPHLPGGRAGLPVLRDRPAAAADAASGGRSGAAGHDRALKVGLEQGRRDLNIQRARLGLPPIDRFHGGISPDLALVATYPQLEYPRRWPAGGRDHRADDLRDAAPRDRAAARRRPARPRRPQHRPRLRQPPGPHGAGGARRGAGAGGGDDQPGRPPAPDRGPRQRHPGRMAQLQPADAGRLAGRSPTAATAPSPAPSAPAPRSSSARSSAT